jgi:hypothetical protein
VEEKFCFLKSFYEGAKRYKNMKPGSLKLPSTHSVLAKFNHTVGFTCNVLILDSLISAVSLEVLPGERVKVTSTPLRGMAGYCQYPEKDSGKSSTI